MKNKGLTITVKSDWNRIPEEILTKCRMERLAYQIEDIVKSTITKDGFTKSALKCKEICIQIEFTNDGKGCWVVLDNDKEGPFFRLGIDVSEQNSEYTILSVCHECVHLKQHISGKKVIGDGDSIFWLGEEFVKISGGDFSSYRHNGKIYAYPELPWEKEAYDNEVGFYSEYAKKHNRKECEFCKIQIEHQKCLENLEIYR